MNPHQVLSGVYYPPEAYDGSSRRFEGTGDNGWECGLYPDATGLDGYTYLMSSNSYEDWNNFDQFSADVTLYADQPRAFQCAVAEMDGGDHIRIRCDSFHAVVSVCLSLFCLSYLVVCESVCSVFMRTHARAPFSHTQMESIIKSHTSPLSHDWQGGGRHGALWRSADRPPSGPPHLQPTDVAGQERRRRDFPSPHPRGSYHPTRHAPLGARGRMFLPRPPPVTQADQNDNHPLCFPPPNQASTISASPHRLERRGLSRRQRPRHGCPCLPASPLLHHRNH